MFQQLHNFALLEIEALLQSNNRILFDFSSMPQSDLRLISNKGNKLIHVELNYDKEVLATEYSSLTSIMIVEQRKIYNTIYHERHCSIKTKNILYV